MLQRGWIGVVIVAGLITGCAPKKPPTTAPAPTPPSPPALTLETAREQFKRTNANAEIGQVVAVLPESNLAAVGDIQSNHFRVGDPITFLDDTLGDLTLGSVIAIQNGRLHVRYDAPPAGRRVPQVGDFAVHMFNGAPPTPQSTAGATAPSSDAAPAAPAESPAPAPAAASDTAPPAAATPAAAPAPAPSADTNPPKQPELNK